MKDININENAFLEMLNEVYGEVEVCGSNFDAGDALRELDPTAFRSSYLDWIDAQIRDLGLIHVSSQDVERLEKKGIEIIEIEGDYYTEEQQQ